MRGKFLLVLHIGHRGHLLNDGRSESTDRGECGWIAQNQIARECSTSQAKRAVDAVDENRQWWFAT